MSGTSVIIDSLGRHCRRDIIQFVPFKEAIRRGDIAKQIMHEIPEQFMSHYAFTGYKPEGIGTQMLGGVDGTDGTADTQNQLLINPSQPNVDFGQII